MDDRTAKRVACDWHGGLASPLYALCSSGAIIWGAVAEVKLELLHDRRDTLTDDERSDLLGLVAYLEGHGERGPVEGWRDLSW